MSYKWVKLSKGHRAKVDAEDFDRVSQLTWFVRSDGYVYHSGRASRFFMHRFVLGYFGDQHIDHINHDPLDNRKINLRICSPSVNGHNRKGLSINNTSNYRGVAPSPWGWHAYVTYNKKRYHL